jgi:hypothetical protein
VSRRRRHRIEELRPGHEHDPGASESEQVAPETGILNHVVLAALHRADGDCIDHQPRLEARLDHKKPTDLFQHRHSLTTQRQSGGFEPFKS